MTYYVTIKKSASIAASVASTTATVSAFYTPIPANTTTNTTIGAFATVISTTIHWINSSTWTTTKGLQMLFTTYFYLLHNIS